MQKEFVKIKKNGYGILKMVDIFYLKGYWINNYLNGEGKYENKYIKYTGSFLNNEFNGKKFPGKVGTMECATEVHRVHE